MSILLKPYETYLTLRLYAKKREGWLNINVDTSVEPRKLISEILKNQAEFRLRGTKLWLVI